MVMEAHFPGVVNMLGVHLAALSVSAVPYRDAEHVSGHMGEGPSVKTAIETGLLFTFVMAVCAVIREILGSASIWGIAIPFMQDFRVSALSGVFGGYLVLAIVFAVMRKVSGKSYEEKEGNEQ
jgi:Na+-translocating ferredoxin:NAD+ oxidoreductase RnfE subunit